MSLRFVTKTAVYTLSALVLHLVRPKVNVFYFYFFTKDMKRSGFWEMAETGFKFRSTAHKLY